MIQEYLFSNSTDADNVKNLEIVSAAIAKSHLNVIVTELLDSHFRIVIINSSKNDEEAAKELSRIDSKIRETFSPVAISNESSSYFNKRLFPVVNDFERRLRKLLYLTSAVHSDDTAASNIQGLEEMDLGQVFELLFTDINFVTEAKKRINKTGGKFSKAEVLQLIERIEENTVWDQLLGEASVPTLKSKYSDIRQYRNDVMHAHNIDYETYSKALKLYRMVNDEIDAAIERIMKRVFNVMPAFGEVMGTLISAFDQLEKTSSDVMDNYAKIASIMSSENYDGITQAIDSWKEALMLLQNGISDSSKNSVDSNEDDEKRNTDDSQVN